MSHEVLKKFEKRLDDIEKELAYPDAFEVQSLRLEIQKDLLAILMDFDDIEQNNRKSNGGMIKPCEKRGK